MIDAMWLRNMAGSNTSTNAPVPSHASTATVSASTCRLCATTAATMPSPSATSSGRSRLINVVTSLCSWSAGPKSEDCWWYFTDWS